ncbi:hypothetical protein FDJ23_gp068 [Erwinia phage vB_EamM_Desertfox]|uniref:Uncharacterized protein n=3 Tax=Agricanvirus TaxID=1984776 RepID=A0A173GFH3_9CAUD|nr:hypothetical protein FDH97_gp071 [Erwinia phage vB_EamM_Deimos-Minion]YP_009621809.1 hypothetical protein FDJ23_gp068 [Erwinia phage vB_EamM_Desertfox]ANH52169.1 hypothetical protein DM_71 [Erwinia phage vB_EamM_Deimos-Minion]AUG86176.1 hypothetical protein DESERTFOX_68 [Erwinia phage vB_EamM_Desertfox]AUG86819.1 hypothetical protein MORTIMER_70 [Erwinia phage vB_EamM_Mortimer]
MKRESSYTLVFGEGSTEEDVNTLREMVSHMRGLTGLSQLGAFEVFVTHYELQRKDAGLIISDLPVNAQSLFDVSDRQNWLTPLFTSRGLVACDLLLLLKQGKWAGEHLKVTFRVKGIRAKA